MGFNSGFKGLTKLFHTFDMWFTVVLML